MSSTKLKYILQNFQLTIVIYIPLLESTPSGGWRHAKMCILPSHHWKQIYIPSFHIQAKIRLSTFFTSYNIFKTHPWGGGGQAWKVRVHIPTFYHSKQNVDFICGCVAEPHNSIFGVFEKSRFNVCTMFSLFEKEIINGNTGIV